MSYRIFEKISQYLPICQVYISGRAYILEDRFSDIFSTVETVFNSTFSQGSVNELIQSKIGKTYKDALNFMDTQRDKDILRGLLTNLSSIRFSTYLEGMLF